MEDGTTVVLKVNAEVPPTNKELDTPESSITRWPNNIGFETFHEEKVPVELQITGAIPSYAAGTLYRTGPGGHQVADTPRGTFSISHWFDGFAQTHRFQILAEKTVDGKETVKVLYNSRQQVDELMERIRKTGSFKDYSFAQKRDPCLSFFGKVMTAFTAVGKATANNTIVHVTVSANSPTSLLGSNAPSSPSSGVSTLQLKTDNFFIKDIDPETLEPIGLARQEMLHPDLKGPLSAAHSKSDPVTGDVFNFNLDFRGRYPTYRVFQVSASTGRTTILASISGPGIYAAYLHSLFLSEDFVILCIWNSHLAYNGLAVSWQLNILDALSPSDSKYPAKWLVIDRRHGNGLVAEFDSPPFFTFHTVNAYQAPSADDKDAVDVFCTLIQYPNTDVIHKFYYDTVMSTSPKAADFQAAKGATSRGKLATYALRGIRSSQTLDRQQKDRLARSAEIVSEMPHIGELPMFNQANRLQRIRFLYTVVDRGYSTLFDGLCKINMQTKTRMYWDNPYGHTPGEAVFVADPNGVEEDDGVLLSVVLDGFEGRSYLLCLDARNMKELGRAQCEWVVGLGFHGQHVRSDGDAVEF